MSGKSGRNVTERRFLRFFNAIAAVIIAAAFSLIYLHVTGDHEKISLMGARHTLEMAAMDVSGQININRERLSAVSSRTMIRRKMAQFVSGELSLAAVRSYTGKKFSDGCRVYTNLVVACRHDLSGREIARYEPVPCSRKLLPLTNEQILVEKGKWLYLCISPIRQGKLLIGYDRGLFRLVPPRGLADAPLNDVRIVSGSRTVQREYLSGRITGTAYLLQARFESSLLPREIDRINFRVFIIGVAASLLIFIFLRLTAIRRAVLLLREQQALSEKLVLHEEELLNEHEIKDRVFSLISHDLKGPFSSLIGVTRLLKSGFDRMSVEELRSMLDILEETGVRAYDLMNNLLSWSTGKIKSRISGQDCEPVAAVCREAVHEIGYLAGQKHCRIDVELTEGVCVSCNRQTLIIILRNLLSNAVKFSRQGGVIEISCSASGEDGVEIRVTDHGLGMDEETLAGLFSFDRNRRRRGTGGEQGSGIGLSLCHDLVVWEGGELKVESVSGEGTRFTLALKRCRCADGGRGD